MNPDGGERLHQFAKNLILIINSFFEYGFRGGGVAGVTTTLDVAQTVPHYWFLISAHFDSYSSVQYINSNFKEHSP